MAEKPLMSFVQLSAAANSLNKATDELTETVCALDSAILNLNIGLAEWVKVAIFHDEEGRLYDRIELGWCKSEGMWRLSIRKLVGDEASPEPDEVREIWAFNNAPRDLRLRAVEKLPQLVDQLGNSAARTAEAVSKKLEETRALATAMGIPGIPGAPKVSK